MTGTRSTSWYRHVRRVSSRAPSTTAGSRSNSTGPTGTRRRAAARAAPLSVKSRPSCLGGGQCHPATMEPSL